MHTRFQSENMKVRDHSDLDEDWNIRNIKTDLKQYVEMWTGLIWLGVGS